MEIFPKIHGLFKRHQGKGPNHNKFIIGQWSLPEFEYLRDNVWNWTEKIDGTNIRVCWYRNPLISTVEFKGRTDKAETPKHLLVRLEEMFDAKKLEKVFPLSEEEPDVYLYGEGFGYKIQGGCKYFNGHKAVDFILFDVKIGKYWLRREDVSDIANNLNIRVVPTVGKGTIQEAIDMVRAGFKSTFGDFLAEGLVLKPQAELLNRMGGRIITKVKTKDFVEDKNE